MTTRAWTQLLRVLTILLNSNLNDDDRAFALRLCGSETFHQLLCRLVPVLLVNLSCSQGCFQYEFV